MVLVSRRSNTVVKFKFMLMAATLTLCDHVWHSPWRKPRWLEVSSLYATIQTRLQPTQPLSFLSSWLPLVLHLLLSMTLFANHPTILLAGEGHHFVWHVRVQIILVCSRFMRYTKCTIIIRLSMKQPKKKLTVGSWLTHRGCVVVVKGACQWNHLSCCKK